MLFHFGPAAGLAYGFRAVGFTMLLLRFDWLRVGRHDDFYTQAVKEPESRWFRGRPNSA